MIHNVIGGRSVPAASGAHRELIDPATGTVHDTATESRAADVDEAVAAAGNAFQSWRHTTPAERSALMLRAADVLEAHNDELAALEVADTGKPRDVTRDEEIPASIDVVRFYAGACRVPEGRSTGEYIEGITSGVRREPVGVCGQITPWNYPFEAVYDEVVERLAEAARGATVGPLISAAQRARVVAMLAGAPPHAKIVAGGGTPERDGFFLVPTVVAGLHQDDELVQAEIFGPVITVQSYRNDDEALAMANGVEQGLTASVWTDSHSRAMRFLRDLDFGAVSVNAHAPMGSELPHGGFGSSGYGKDLGMYGLDDYTRIKHVAHALSRSTPSRAR